MSDLVNRLRKMASIETSALFSQRETLNEAASRISQQDAELERMRRHIELLQEKDASQCACSIDTPDDVCLFHVRMKAEARKAAFIEAAEIAGKLFTAEFTPQEPGFMRGIGYAAQTIFDDLRAKAEETGHE